MNWLSVETAPFDRDLELAVIDFDGVHPLVFACRRVLGGWVKANTNMLVRICPTHWREWNNKTGSSTYQRSAEGRLPARSRSRDEI